MVAELSDAAWLAARTYRWAADAQASFAWDATGYRGIVVPPTHIAHALRAGNERVVAVAGYPTGRHHSLIKASEARLAIQQGAHEAWVSVDDTNADPNSVLADLIAVREACPRPAELGLLLPAEGALSAARLAELATTAGYERVIAYAPVDAALEVVAWADDDDAAVAALGAGAAALVRP